jgi:chromosome segregation ATPase
MVADLQASQQRLFSDAEDRVLESRYKLEDMRKERAELRSKLSRKEKEIASVKDVFAGFKSKIQAQLDQKDSVLKSFQSERSEVAFQTEQLESVRHELFEVLESVGFCNDVVKRISIAEEDPSVDDGTYKCVRELSYWRDIIPSIGKSITLICQRQRKVNHLEQEAESLQEDLYRLKGVESDYKKQVEDEKVQNEKLFTLLRQAELEMERSAKQIREMSAALSRLQQQEVEANEKAKAFESECTHIQEELVKVHLKMEEERNNAQLRLSEVTAALRNKESELSEANEQL